MRLGMARAQRPGDTPKYRSLAGPVDAWHDVRVTTEDGRGKFLPFGRNSQAVKV